MADVWYSFQPILKVW